MNALPYGQACRGDCGGPKAVGEAEGVDGDWCTCEVSPCE